MGIPTHTRILLIPEDESATREYGISRGMVLTLLLLATVTLAVLALLLVSFARKHDERQRIAHLEAQLAEAREAVGMMAELDRELADMRETEEKLLLMLGIDRAEPADADSIDLWLERAPGSAAEGLQRVASVVLGRDPNRWPAAGYVTREFDEGNPPRGVTPHLGIDIAGPQDAPVLAAAAGTVARTGKDEYLGNFVEIQHGLGYLTVYGHCSRIAVRAGDRIDGGQIVAYLGQSGQAGAPHLHFETWLQGEAVDPRRILEGDPPRK